MHAQLLSRSLLIGVSLVVAGGAVASAQPQPGECASGYCGTPKNNGGGGCGCGGGSILVNNTDIGKTYSKTDDYDADGIADDFDNCPFVANRDQADQDGDKIGDVCDNCVAAANPDQHDVNLNAIGDVCDPDIDGDKVMNAGDNCPYVPNVNQRDTDKNGLGDVCDPDMDGDKVMNRVDNCPLVYNPDQSKSAPGRFGDACDDDTDKDAIEDARDNCPAVYNPDQLDTNGNGLGDACDPDIDGDTIGNVNDNCPLVANKDQKDSDRDGVGDACQTHGFCFVAAMNDHATCLDPKSVFAVTAGPLVPSKFTGMAKVATGGNVFPAIYSNRENVSIRYAWTVVSQPDGANDVVKTPRGTVSVSNAFQYCYDASCDPNQANRPTFVPSHPGTYKLNLSADLVQNDPLFPGVVHAESEVEIQADGQVVQAGGCSVGGHGGGYGGLASAALLVAFGLLLRRRGQRSA
jgi:hypothetical protein